MPLYELILISRVDIPKEKLKDLIKHTCTQILDQNGVVRSITNMKTRVLPYKMRNHNEVFEKGFYWALKFDLKSSMIRPFKKKLGMDTRIIKQTVIKLGTGWITTPGLIE